MKKINIIKYILIYSVCVLVLIITIFLTSKNIYLNINIKNIKTIAEKSLKPKYFENSELIIENNIKGSSEIVIEEKIEITNNFEDYLNENENVINFYCNSFQIEKDIIINEIKELNISNLNKEYDSFDKALFYIILDLFEEKPELFSNNLKSNTKSKEYILALIDYFGSFYEIDIPITKAIADVESGFKSSSMLKKNNIFGGISKGKLISYKTIEFGVFKYVKLLNDGYFSKGLTTIEEIGKKYNPTLDENGNKIASPTWVEKVNIAILKYNDNKTISINELLGM